MVKLKGASQAPCLRCWRALRLERLPLRRAHRKVARGTTIGGSSSPCVGALMLRSTMARLVVVDCINSCSADCSMCAHKPWSQPMAASRLQCLQPRAHSVTVQQTQHAFQTMRTPSAHRVP
jgi:hypothetical protein